MSVDSVYEERELLSRIVNGDRKAFDQIYRKYWSALYDSACKRLNDKTLAEDLVQEVFLRFWNKRAGLKIDKLEAYLHTAARYEVLTYVSRNRAPLSFYEPFEALFLEKELPDAKINVQELIDLIAHYANTLPEKRKQIFLLHINERLSTKEMAEMLNISQKTVQNQLATALKGLKSHLDNPAIMLMLIQYLGK